MGRNSNQKEKFWPSTPVLFCPNCCIHLLRFQWHLFLKPLSEYFILDFAKLHLDQQQLKSVQVPGLVFLNYFMYFLISASERQHCITSVYTILVRNSTSYLICSRGNTISNFFLMAFYNSAKECGLIILISTSKLRVNYLCLFLGLLLLLLLLRISVLQALSYLGTHGWPHK